VSWRRVPQALEAPRGLRLLYDAPVPGPRVLAVVRSIVRSNPRIDPFDALVLAGQAIADAREHHLDADFFCSALLQESGFAPDALSAAGAVGIAQFTLGTAADEGVNPFNWSDAMRGSAELFGRYVRAYDGIYPDPYAAALAAYDAGPGNVAYYHGVPPFAETRDYIGDVYYRWSRLLAEQRRGHR
jgi:soluble lytic murein transglycosylase-like protein